MKHVNYYETSDGKQFNEDRKYPSDGSGYPPSARLAAKNHEFDLLAKPIFEARKSEFSATKTLDEVRKILSEIVVSAQEAMETSEIQAETCDEMER